MGNANMLRQRSSEAKGTGPMRAKIVGGEKPDLRSALRGCPTSVAVVTTRDDNGVPHGVTIGSFGSLSLTPPLVLWSLRRDAGSHRIFREARYFAVNVLASSQEEISRRFSTPGIDRFGDLAFSNGLNDLPIIDGCVANIECESSGDFPGGDHTIFLGLVQRAKSFNEDPLIFCRGGYLKTDAKI